MAKNYMNFTEDRFERFKKAYDACESSVFIFEHKQFLKEYAGHLIDYLGKEFDNAKVHG